MPTGKRIEDLLAYGAVDAIKKEDDILELSKNSGTPGFPAYASDGSRQIKLSELRTLLGTYGGASNGLNDTLGDVQWGGELTSNVLINGDSGTYDIAFGDGVDPANNIGNFDIFTNPGKHLNLQCGDASFLYFDGDDNVDFEGFDLLISFGGSINISGASSTTIYGDMLSLLGGDRVVVNSTNAFAMRGIGSYYANIDTNLLTEGRNFAWPDQSGTIALLSDISIADNAVTYPKSYNGIQSAIISSMKLLSGN